MHRFSFLLPTRGRVDSLKRFLNSVLETAHAPESIEVVLVVDDDDPDSHHVTMDGLTIRTIIVPPGATMGVLNNTACAASSGQYVMLINDDVVARTQHWDREMYVAFQSFGDDVGLIHTNDLLFREKLCTFPALSRAACERIGVCPPEYRRYRIDDHISDTYNILGHLGYPRLLYLEHVVFEHFNHQEQADAGAEIFESEDRKVYQPNQVILAEDARRFDDLIEQRKTDALALASLIAEAGVMKHRQVWERRIAMVDRPLVHRRGEFTRAVSPASAERPLEHASVTVAVVTGDLERPHARQCIERIKAHSGKAEIVLLDNNRSANFNHAREMNRILGMARTDYVALLDDDVYVDKRWLDGMVHGFDADTGVVGPLHKDRDGSMSHSGVYFAGDDWGSHAHLTDIPAGPRVSPMLCSACLLVDVKKCGHIRFNEAYRKYFLDLDYSLQVWESGFKVVISPFTTVTHLAGATMAQGSGASQVLWEQDMVTFRNDWLVNGRLERLQRDVMDQYPYLVLLNGLPQRIIATCRQDDWDDLAEFEHTVSRLLASAKVFPLFQRLMVDEVSACLARANKRGDVVLADCCRRALGQLEGVERLDGGPAPSFLERYGRFNLVQFRGGVLAIPRSLGHINVRIEAERTQDGILSAKTLEEIKDLIERSAHGAAVDDAPREADADGGAQPVLVSEPPALMHEGYRGFNLIRWNGRYYAIPQGEGAFTTDAVRARKYSRSYDADSLPALRSQVDRGGSATASRAARRLGNFLSRMTKSR